MDKKELSSLREKAINAREIQWMANGETVIRLLDHIDALEGQLADGDKNYVSAVNGRKDFRQAYRESRDVVNKLKSPTDEMWNTVWKELSDHKFYAVCKALSIDQIRSLFEMFHQNMVKAAIASAQEE